jgi:hypothetical protein
MSDVKQLIDEIVADIHGAFGSGPEEACAHINAYADLLEVVRRKRRELERTMQEAGFTDKQRILLRRRAFGDIDKALRRLREAVR